MIMIRKNWKKAAELLLADYDKLKNSAGYQYDLANVLEQVLSNTAQEYQKKMAAAFRSGDAEEFSTLSDKFLSIIDMVEKSNRNTERISCRYMDQRCKETGRKFR